MMDGMNEIWILVGWDITREIKRERGYTRRNKKSMNKPY